MPIGGLPAPAAGSIALSAISSVFVSSSGLALLGGTRPQQHSGGRALNAYVRFTFGSAGAFFLFVGLVLDAMPMLVGVSTDREGKAAAVLQCTKVLVCWAAERHLILGQPPPAWRSLCCALVWFSTTLIAWAGPRPQDNVSLGLAGQMAGCDGGYRSPFLIYSSVWMTGVSFGFLLLVAILCRHCGEECQGEADDSLAQDYPDGEPENVRDFFRAALAIVYGFATSMSGLVFAIGTSRDEMGWIVFGAGLLCLAASCAWTALWKLGVPLSTWSILGHGCFTLQSLIQEHFVFRDFRWEPESETGLLAVWKWPGLQLFLFGVLLLVSTLLMFMATGDEADGTRELSSIDADDVDNLHHRSRSMKVPSLSPNTSEAGDQKRPKQLYFWQWLVLPICMGSLVLGLTRPLCETEITLPYAVWAHGEDAMRKFESSTQKGRAISMTSTRSYIDLISAFYDKRLPCSALFVAYNGVILPPLQFMGMLIVLVQPAFVSDGMLQFVRHELAKRAMFRFVSPMYLMVMVGFLNLSGPEGALFEALGFGASFGRGFYFFVFYWVLSHILAQSLLQEFEDSALELGAEEHVVEEPPCGSLEEMGIVGLKVARHSNKEAVLLKLPVEGPSMRDRKEIKKLSRHDDLDSCSDATSEDLDGEAMEATVMMSVRTLIVCAVGFVLVSGCTMYVGLTRPFLSFTYRVAGVTVSNVNPTLIDIWHSLATSNRLLSFFAAGTMLLVLPLWVILLGLRLPTLMTSGMDSWFWRSVSFAEQATRPWVLGHVWALAIVVIIYIARSRSKAIVEVCLHAPDPPIGMVAIVVMGLGVYALIKCAEAITQTTRPSWTQNRSIVHHLPGGVIVWNLGPISSVLILSAVFWQRGPRVTPALHNLIDVNTVLSTLMPNGNDRLHRWLPETYGDCQAYGDYIGAGMPRGLPVDGVGIETSSPSKESRCMGRAPLAHLSSNEAGGVDATALWVTGLNTLEITDFRVLPPWGVNADLKRWTLNVSGVFTNVHVWIKVLLNGEEWVSDYLCCDKAFHFRIQASTKCSESSGFDPVVLRVTYNDPVELKHRIGYESEESTALIEYDYGRQSMVEQALSDFIAGKGNARFLLKSPAGETLDAFSEISHLLEDVVKLTTGNVCPHQY